MASRNTSHETSPDQPAFIDVTYDGFSGQKRITGISEDGYFPVAPEPYIPPTTITEEQLAASAAFAATANRRLAQLGKHSARDEKGDFTNVKPGKVLPGFGIVTHTNLNDAKSFADKLNEQMRSQNEPHTDVEIPLLDSRQRLEALQNDPRAKFIPSTHTEKVTALSVLDAKSRLDVYRYFNETRRKQYKEGRKNGMSDEKAKEYAQDAFRSRLHEVGDFLASATTDIIALEDLQSKTNDIVSPRLKLTESIGWHPGYAPFVRYLDGVAMQSGKEFSFSPLTPVEDRPAQNFDGQHKIIDDPYTAPSHKTENVSQVQAHIQEVIAAETIGSLRSAVRLPEGNFITRLDKAIENQQNRQKFWLHVLESFTGNDARLAQNILKTLGFSR